MGYLRFGATPSPESNKDDLILNSNVVTVRRHNARNLDLIYNVQHSGAGSPDMGIGQIRLQGETDWKNEDIVIINNAIITAETQAFVNVRFDSGQKIKLVDINPQNP